MDSTFDQFSPRSLASPYDGRGRAEGAGEGPLKKNSESEPSPELACGRDRGLRGSQTEVECRRWAGPRHRQFKGAKFRRQHPIAPDIAAFVCPNARLVIELDGGQRDVQTQRVADEQRMQYFQPQATRCSDSGITRYWKTSMARSKRLRTMVKVPHPALRAGLSRKGEGEEGRAHTNE